MRKRNEGAVRAFWDLFYVKGKNLIVVKGLMSSKEAINNGFLLLF